MNKFLLLVSFLLASGAVRAQKLAAKQVPATAIEAFAHAFPDVKHAKWEKEQENYEAGFQQKGVEMSAVFSAAGALLETETAVPYTRLPPLARTLLAQQYKGYQITEVAKITAASGMTTYEAEVRKSGKKQDILFDTNGRLLK